MTTSIYLLSSPLTLSLRPSPPSPDPPRRLAVRIPTSARIRKETLIRNVRWKNHWNVHWNAHTFIRNVRWKNHWNVHWNAHWSVFFKRSVKRSVKWNVRWHVHPNDSLDTSPFKWLHGSGQIYSSCTSYARSTQRFCRVGSYLCDVTRILHNIPQPNTRTSII